MIGRVTYRGISAVLAVIGVGVAGYLTYIHYNMSVLICTPGGGCDTVQNSRYAAIGAVPVAVLGLLMYLGLLALGFIRRTQRDLYEPASMAAFAIALGGVAYAAYLTYLEIYVIHAICEWCVSSAIITFLIMLLEGYGVWRILGGEGLPPEYDDEPPSPRRSAATTANGAPSRPASNGSTASASAMTAAASPSGANHDTQTPVPVGQNTGSSSGNGQSQARPSNHSQSHNRNRSKRKAKRR